MARVPGWERSAPLSGLSSLCLELSSGSLEQTQDCWWVWAGEVESPGQSIQTQPKQKVGSGEKSSNREEAATGEKKLTTLPGSGWHRESVKSPDNPAFPWLLISGPQQSEFTIQTPGYSRLPVQGDHAPLPRRCLVLC